MKPTLKFLCLLFLFIGSITSQYSQTANVKIYSASKVVDPDYGIKMYEKLNFNIGGDSVRNDKKGYACQGWVEDEYDDGKLLHKGYYEDGRLKIYKNFFPNGNVERSFKINDFKRSTMQIFYSDGKKKTEVNYYEGSPQIWTDYYANGQIEYTEESTKSMEYLIYRRSYSEDGKPQEVFELSDLKKKMYTKKEYYEDGKIKEEGMMHFSSAVFDYQKEGVWKIYDESGKESIEKWAHGEKASD